MISIKNVSYHVDGTSILDDINVEIPKGGLTALIGPNGAGKSTLLSLMSRLKPLQHGSIQVDDLKIGECANVTLARRLAILSQTLEVVPRLSVRQLVTFGRYPHHKGMPDASDHAAVTQALEEFDLQEISDRMIDSVSGGQRQRALVAMIFAQNTPYMLLDEPLNNLDITASRHLMHRLRDFADKHNRTIIIVLHDINYAARYADRIISMKDGKIWSVGPPSEVVTSETLNTVFGTTAVVRQIDGSPVVLV